MKFLLVLFAISLAFAYVFAHPQQYFLGQIPPARFGLSIPSQASGRDPRLNRGPVVFPPSPPNPDDTTSGVIVGASGYGFVPPQQTGQVYYLTTVNSPSPTYTAYDYFSSPFEHRFNLF